MVLENGIYTGFRPKFKNLDEDRERYLFAILDLHDAGKIEQPEGQSLYSAYAELGYAWIDAQYWERGLYDQIEAHHCHSEIAFGPIYEGSAKVANRFVELGQAHRGRRIWRNHLASQLQHYWFFADEKRKGFRMSEGWLAPEQEQRQDHERTIAKLPGKKAEILDMMRTATNVAGQALVPTIVARREGILDVATYNAPRTDDLLADEPVVLKDAEPVLVGAR